VGVVVAVAAAAAAAAVDPECPLTTPFSAFCTAIHSFVTGEPRDFVFGTLLTIARPTLPKKNLP